MQERIQAELMTIAEGLAELRAAERRAMAAQDEAALKEVRRQIEANLRVTEAMRAALER